MNLVELPQLSIPDPGALLETLQAGLSPAAASATVPVVAVTLAALALLLAGTGLVRRRGRIRALEARSEEAAVRVQTLEVLLADLSAEASQLRQRVGELAARQDTLASGQARSGLRQAIALSRHGATTRQLIETCSLSQGEAHLIQTMYGRPAPDADGIH
jgi:hypothetical protein